MAISVLPLRVTRPAGTVLKCRLREPALAPLIQLGPAPLKVTLVNGAAGVTALLSAVAEIGIATAPTSDGEPSSCNAISVNLLSPLPGVKFTVRNETGSPPLHAAAQ